MARGSVRLERRRVGLGEERRVRVVVVQADRMDVLATMLVVPLVDALGPAARDPTGVAVSRAEAGTADDQVAIVPALRAVPASALEPTPVGQLEPETVRQLDAKLRLILDLP